MIKLKFLTTSEKSPAHKTSDVVNQTSLNLIKPLTGSPCRRALALAGGHPYAWLHLILSELRERAGPLCLLCPNISLFTHLVLSPPWQASPGVCRQQPCNQVGRTPPCCRATAPTLPVGPEPRIAGDPRLAPKVGPSSLCTFLLPAPSLLTPYAGLSGHPSSGGSAQSSRDFGANRKPRSAVPVLLHLPSLETRIEVTSGTSHGHMSCPAGQAHSDQLAGEYEPAVLLQCTSSGELSRDKCTPSPLDASGHLLSHGLCPLQGHSLSPRHWHSGPGPTGSPAPPCPQSCLQ